MKIKLSLVLVFLVSFSLSFFSGCGSSSSTNQVQASSANFSTNYIYARVGDVLNLDTKNPFNIQPQNISANYVFSSSNSNIASINALTGEIECLNEGAVIIYGLVRNEDTQDVGDSFTLNIQEQLVYATDFELQTSEIITVGIDEVKTNNIIFEGENVNVLPIISYSNSNIVNYNKVTGELTPISIGQTTVIVTLQLANNSAITKQFEVNVVKKINYIQVQNIYNALTQDYFYIHYEVIDNTQENLQADLQEINIQVIFNGHLIEIVENNYSNILVATNSNVGIATVRLIWLGDNTITKEVSIVINE
jgi:hypothetical protein